MTKFYRALLVSAGCLLLFVSLNARETPKYKAKYVKKSKDPVLEQIKKENEQAREEREAETRKIRDAQKEEKRKEDDEKQVLTFDLVGVEKPTSLEVFEQVFHFEPVRQFMTGTCWDFSTTSYFESEVYRLTDRKIKLSEMFTAYHEYLEEARRYVRERGDSYFDEGSEGNAVILTWREHGIVPTGAYKGELDPQGRYDHTEMVAEMKGYLDFIKGKDYWDEDLILSSLGLIMDKYMGFVAGWNLPGEPSKLSRLGLENCIEQLEKLKLVNLKADDPHELVRCNEVMNIIDVGIMMVKAALEPTQYEGFNWFLGKQVNGEPQFRTTPIVIKYPSKEVS